MLRSTRPGNEKDLERSRSFVAQMDCRLPIVVIVLHIPIFDELQYIVRREPDA